MSDALDPVRAQARAIETLRRAVREDRLASAYLFEGPSGVGKEMTAVALAQATIGSATRIAAGNHPDVRIFAPRDEGNRNIKVDFLRQEILPYAEFAPFEAQHAFLIFPEVDVSFPEAHPESANALLKTLEEPKKGVHFLLLAERPDRLLPTIRSRCQRLPFSRLPSNVVGEILAAHDVPEADRGAAVALADGRADRALKLATDSAARMLFELAVEIDDAVGRPEPGRLVDVADSLAKHEDLDLALETLALFYRDIACVCCGLDDERLAFRHSATALRRCAERLDARRASSRVQLIHKTMEELEVNANRSIAMDALLYRMRAP